MNKLFIIPLFALLLIACKDEEPRTQAFFSQNKTDRTQVLEECRSDKGERSKVKDEECTNAATAAFYDRGTTRVRTIKEIQEDEERKKKEAENAEIKK